MRDAGVTTVAVQERPVSPRQATDDGFNAGLVSGALVVGLTIIWWFFIWSEKKA